MTLADDHITMWWFTLGGGLVLAVVVTLLLALLYRLVSQIDDAVSDAWNAGTRVAANTSTTWMLRQAGERVDQLREELDAHVEMLGSRRG